MRFDLALRLLDLAADHAVFNDVVFLHAHQTHRLLHPVRGEDAHQVVFQRQVEARRTRVTLAARTAAQLVVDTARFVALGADDVQAAGGLDLLVATLPFGLDLELVVRVGIFAQRVQLCFQRTAQHDVGTATGHVGGDGHRARHARVGDDGRFAVVLLGVQHFMVHAGLAQVLGQHFRGFNRGGTDQHRLAVLVAFLDVGQHRIELAVAVEEHLVRRVLADGRAVGRNDHHFQAVDALEFVRFGVGRTGHAGQLLVHAEQILEGDAGQGLVLALDRHAFLRFHRLVQAIGPAAAGQGTAGEFVDDHHFTVAHDVIDVALVDRMRAQRGIEVVHHGQVLRRVQAFGFRAQNAGVHQQLLGVLHARFGQVHLLALLVDPEIAFGFFIFLADQAGHHAVDADVQLRGVVGRAGDDQRGTRFVDQDRVDFVDDGVVQAALVAVGTRQRHVVAQVVEAEFVVGAVGDVAVVGLALVAVRHARVHHAHAQAQPVVQLAHLAGVAAGQVVVHGDHVHALAFQRVQVHRQGRHQGLAFAGAHFGDLAQVQHHAADQLHIVVAHAQHAAAGFTADREGLRQHLVQSFAVGDALLELGGLGLELLVGELFDLRFQGVDLGDDAVELAQLSFITTAEDAGKQAVDH